MRSGTGVWMVVLLFLGAEGFVGDRAAATQNAAPTGQAQGAAVPPSDPPLGRDREQPRLVPNAGVGGVQVLRVQGQVYMLVGAGSNIAVQTGDEGILLVDTGTAQMSEQVLATIRQLSDKPIRYIINTHVHPDHAGGNERIGKAGSTTRGGPTEIVAHENVLRRMSAPFDQQAPMAAAAWPTTTYLPEDKDFSFNDEAVMLYHDRAAHTDGDTIVFFRRSDVVVAGDIFVTSSYPVIASQDGGSVEGIIDGLNRILTLTVPKHEQEGGTYVIPGHGRLCDEAEVLEYRDMVTIVRDRVEDMVRRGLTVEQVKAARPTLDYDGRYGPTSGAWTPGLFVEAVYRDVSRRVNQKPPSGAGGATRGSVPAGGRK